MQRRAFANDPEDSQAAALYERTAGLIFAYLRVHTASLEDAEDLLLEIFLAALEWKPILSLPPGEQTAWLRQVAHNKLVDYFRRAARHPTVTLEHVPPLLEGDTMLTPEQQTLRQEERRRLNAALGQLEPLQRQVLYLRFSVGLRCAQIGLVIGKREDAVRQLLSRTLSSLRALYGER
ncbi:MAG TPA: sigma-70 family RNA polymerase sigma factor [Ktedonobacterales bacterium]|nr:sigma-70 family RNA polymerase sigma factor [Ktedonobacterales bacterium]